MHRCPAPRPPARRRPSLLLVLATGLAAFLGAPRATAQLDVTSISVSPEVPTWQDPVTVTVEGTSPCEVSGEPDRTGVRVQAVVLSLDCPPIQPLPPSAFTLSVDLGRLEPGEWSLRIETEDSLVEEQPLRIRSPEDVLVRLPEAPVTDEEPFVAELNLFTSWLDTVVLSAEDGLIAVQIDTNSPFLPPDPTLQADTLQLPPLAAGDWELRVFVTHGSPLDEARVTRHFFRVHDADRCLPDATTLCVGDGRFRVRATWEDFEGGRGDGRAVELEGRDDSGAFWFFRDSNLELTVKVLDGCGVNGHHWVFLAPGSTTRWEVTVTDLAAPGQPERTYTNALGALPALVADTTAFATCP